MAVLKLHSDHLRAIRTHAESTYPEECCGLLVGQLSEDCKTVVEVLPTQNAWSADSAEEFREITGSNKLGSDKRDRYVIAPETLLRVQREVRDRHLNIIGIYHSHPDHSAVPSEFDRALAWSVYSYIIVSVKQGQTADLRNWSLDDAHQFQLEEMIEASV